MKKIQIDDIGFLETAWEANLSWFPQKSVSSWAQTEENHIYDIGFLKTIETNTDALTRIKTRLNIGTSY